MERRERYSAPILVLELAAALLALLFLTPFYFIIANSFKTLGEILINAASWPTEYNWDNYSKVWKQINFPLVFTNSLLITVFSVAGIVLISTMCAYRLVRRPTAFNNLLFNALVASMIIPFQSIMLQLVRVTSLIELRGHMYGIVACYLGFGLPLSMFLFHGFIKSVPIEIEEAAVVDGSSPYGVFWRIVFPLLSPIIVTVVILNTLWIWNDYLLPVLVIGGNKNLTTIPLGITKFFGQYTKQWNLALPGLAIGIAPVIAFFLFLQKYIVEGITAGSIKG
ncbi:carbohydrate ABC transporter permease [Paenibacillus montanisoli]|uniref:Carbohydrate ABC transporter permease n=1 Tax=Paenibacillus montanisoli TaxID=2081970 RepID=A0A328TY70_9BACL|nr:carbohydrate ABC transporter permease [Paenibacillus montanisoli]RAP74081.1 carbohydrate ABC transporter permease [Paenibacillus montanisoli]